MNLRLYYFSFFLLFYLTAISQNLTIYQSKAGVKETTEQLVQLIRESELTYFETISYDSSAIKMGVKLNATRAILFEDQKLTYKIISCQQTTALDLPLKILIWEENEDVYIGFNDPRDMYKRFMLNGCEDTIEAMTRLMVKLVNDTIRAQQ